ncbi:unnamed protein product [Cylindrotheca closterium]|uniref:Uncharacterized protein n=1 Tax=Cylindrotheca closterium TaxID=2856 RepID=A0AAD2FKU8_9STRA|nr:unnamed protein product [Cylindrotheca closterium]
MKKSADPVHDFLDFWEAIQKVFAMKQGTNKNLMHFKEQFLRQAEVLQDLYGVACNRIPMQLQSNKNNSSDAGSSDKLLHGSGLLSKYNPQSTRYIEDSHGCAQKSGSDPLPRKRPT